MLSEYSILQVLTVLCLMRLAVPLRRSESMAQTSCTLVNLVSTPSLPRPHCAMCSPI